jgi:hypothetical protein
LSTASPESSRAHKALCHGNTAHAQTELLSQLPSLTLLGIHQLISSSLRPIFCLRMAGKKRCNPKTPSPKKRSNKKTRATQPVTQGDSEIHLPGGALQTSFRIESMVLLGTILAGISESSLIYQQHLMSHLTPS